MKSPSILKGSQVIDAISPALRHAAHIRIATPFLTSAGADLLLNALPSKGKRLAKIDLLVKFDDISIGAGACSVEGLAKIRDEAKKRGFTVRIRLRKSLHAKMIMTTTAAGSHSDIVGSANVTYMGLSENGNDEACVYLKGKVCEQNRAIWEPWFANSTSVTDGHFKDWEKRLDALRKKYGGQYPPSLTSCRVGAQENDYFESLWWILSTSASTEGLTLDRLRYELTAARTADEAEDLDQDRLPRFLQHLALIDIEDGRLILTSIGEEVLLLIDDKAAKKKVYDLLQDRYPALGEIEKALSPTKYRTYKQTIENMPSPAVRDRFLRPASGDKTRAIDYPVASTVKQWLLALGRIDEQKHTGGPAHIEFRRAKG